MKWLMKIWNRRRRNIDVEILWPSCKGFAPNLDQAKAAFALHAFNDPAWADLSENEIISKIEELK